MVAVAAAHVVVSPLSPPPYLERTSGVRVEILALLLLSCPLVRLCCTDGRRETPHVLFEDAFGLCEKLVESFCNHGSGRMLDAGMGEDTWHHVH